MPEQSARAGSHPLLQGRSAKRREHNLQLADALLPVQLTFPDTAGTNNSETTVVRELC